MKRLQAIKTGLQTLERRRFIELAVLGEEPVQFLLQLLQLRRGKLERFEDGIVEFQAQIRRQTKPYLVGVQRALQRGPCLDQAKPGLLVTLENLIDLDSGH